MSPFSSVVSCIPRKKLRVPQSFRENSDANFVMTMLINASDDAIRTISSTNIKKKVVMLSSEKMNRD